MSVFMSYDVYGPSVNRPGRKMVYAKPDATSASSPRFLFFKTPKRLRMTNGISFVRSTPIELTSTKRTHVAFDCALTHSTTFFTET